MPSVKSSPNPENFNHTDARSHLFPLEKRSVTSFFSSVAPAHAHSLPLSFTPCCFLFFLILGIGTWTQDFYTSTLLLTNISSETSFKLWRIIIMTFCKWCSFCVLRPGKKIGISWQFKQKRWNCLENIIILISTLLFKNVSLPIVLSRIILVFFYNSIILLTCVKWVKTLKWQQHLEETWEMTVELHWDKEALNPLQCAQPSPALRHSSPTAESVGTASLMDTALCSVALWMTPLRGVHVGFPHLSLSPNMWFSRESCTGRLMFLQKHCVLPVHC